MDLSGVKLVVTEMDGTLLNSKGEVSQLFFEQFQELKENSIHFCAASGRQHNSIAAKLDAIKEDIYIIAENGGVTKKGDLVLASHFLAKEQVLRLIPTLRKINRSNIVLCGDNCAFIESKDEQFIDLFQEYYHSFEQVEDLMLIAQSFPIFKIAVYHFDSSEDFVYPEIQHLKEDVLLKISGQHLLDISAKHANKGNALKEVQEILTISKEETLVIGDYHNDIEMMEQAEFSFAMENAHQDIKTIAKYQTKSNNNYGVETVLERVLNAVNR